MTIRIGTSYFISRAAANRYYSAQGFSAADVGHKLAEGEIHIGRPERPSGATLGLIRDEGRWAILYEDSTTVPMDQI